MTAFPRPTVDETHASIIVVDTGLGNLHSVRGALERSGAAVTISDDAREFSAADGLVLPGVGSFGHGMANTANLHAGLIEAVDRGQPLFGICLGLQMLLSASEEAPGVDGLDLIPGTNRRFDHDEPIPHMGWNEVRFVKDNPLVEGIDAGYAYFVHSYYPDPEDTSTTIAETDYGGTFPAILASESGTLGGAQFHPEKSGALGLELLQNFVRICAR